MKARKEATRPCPNCSMPLPRANYRHYLKHCHKCYATICNTCSFDGHCHDCFTSAGMDVFQAQYYIDKYGAVKEAT